MGSKEHLSDGGVEITATALELWAVGELGDTDAEGGYAVAATVVVALMLALAAFFLAFAPTA